MEVKIEKLSAPVKFTVKVPAEDVKAKKIAIFESIKDNLQIPGFRKGTLTRELAESKLGLENLYKPLIDEIYLKVREENNIISAGDFKIYGMKNDTEISMEFIAEVKPSIKIPALSTIDLKYNCDLTVTEEETTSQLELLQKQNEIEEAVDEKKQLENFDLAIIDFEGILVNETKPFAGGSAKDFKIVVNQLVNGKHQFVDNFEDQLVGMTIGDVRDVKVKFPDDYRDTSKASKEAIFKVTLKNIKKLITPTVEQLAIKMKGFSSIEDYKKYLQETILTNKVKDYDEGFRRQMIAVFLEKCDITPIPQAMVSIELDRQWNAMLQRIGKTEKEFTSKNQNGKDQFIARTEKLALDTVKTSLFLEQFTVDFAIAPTKEEILKYIDKASTMLNYSPVKKAKLVDDLDNNAQQYAVLATATANEKVVDYLIDYFKKK